jgi:hypothetical protein
MGFATVGGMPDKITSVSREALRGQLRRAFESPREFTSSPLYRALSRTVAAEDRLLDLASRGRPGQYPTFLFFGAVHRTCSPACSASTSTSLSPGSEPPPATG